MRIVFLITQDLESPSWLGRYGSSQSGVVKLVLGFGLPVVVSDTVSDELIRKRKDAIVIPVGDVQKLSKTKLDLISRGLSKNLEGPENSWLDLINAVEDMSSMRSSMIWL